MRPEDSMKSSKLRLILWSMTTIRNCLMLRRDTGKKCMSSYWRIKRYSRRQTISETVTSLDNLEERSMNTKEEQLTFSARLQILDVKETFSKLRGMSFQFKPLKILRKKEIRKDCSNQSLIVLFLSSKYRIKSNKSFNSNLKRNHRKFTFCIMKRIIRQHCLEIRIWW